MSKLDNIIALMDAHHFKNLKEICEIPVHKAAIEAIINEQPSEEIVHLKAEIERLKVLIPHWNLSLDDISFYDDILILTEHNEIYNAHKTKKDGFKANDPAGGGLVYINSKIVAWQPLPPVEGL